MTKIPKRLYRTFPIITEQKMPLMLNVLRHEPVQVILAFYLNDIDDPDFINGDLYKLAGERITDIPQWLDEVLEPPHLVEKTTFPEERSRGGIPRAQFEPASAGLKYGAPTAQFTLRYCIDNGIMLSDLFGRHILEDQPTTFRRYRLLKELYERDGKSINLSSLSRNLLCANETLHRDLETLKGLELVVVDLLDVDKHVSNIFRWNWEKPFGLGDYDHQQVREVARRIFERKSVSIRDLVTGTGFRSEDVIRAISRLRAQGLIKPVGERLVEHEYSISLSERGIRFWKDYFQQLYNFFAGRQILSTFDSIEAALGYIKKTLTYNRSHS